MRRYIELEALKAGASKAVTELEELKGKGKGKGKRGAHATRPTEGRQRQV